MEERYSRNIPAVSAEDMETLRQSRILVAGCGGLGGFIIEYLARIGVGSLTVADGDTFCLSNLNRQILSTAGNIGRNKALAAADRVREINASMEPEEAPLEISRPQEVLSAGVQDVLRRAVLRVGAGILRGAAPVRMPEPGRGRAVRSAPAHRRVRHDDVGRPGVRPVFRRGQRDRLFRPYGGAA